MMPSLCVFASSGTFRPWSALLFRNLKLNARSPKGPNCVSHLRPLEVDAQQPFMRLLVAVPVPLSPPLPGGSIMACLVSDSSLLCTADLC